MEYSFKKTGNPTIDAHLQAQQHGFSAGKITLKQAHEKIINKRKFQEEFVYCLFPILDTEVKQEIAEIKDHATHADLLQKFSLSIENAREYFKEGSDTLNNWAYTMVVISLAMNDKKLKKILGKDMSLLLKSYRLAFFTFIEDSNNIVLTNFFPQTVNIAKLAFDEMETNILLSIYQEKEAEYNEAKAAEAE